MRTRTACSLAVVAFGLAAIGTASAYPGSPSPQSEDRGSMSASPQQMDEMGDMPSFGEADSNGDGFIARSEVPDSMHMLRAHFMQYDLNHDGKLSQEEYSAIVNARARGDARARER